MNYTPTFLNLEYIFNKILEFFRAVADFFSGNGSSAGSAFHILLTILSIFFIALIAYCAVRMMEIRAKEHHHLEHEIAEYAEHQAKHAKNSEAAGHIVNERWEDVLKYLSSQNSSDWKVAIIEADTMLEDMTLQWKFEGENLGERLKSADKDKFKTLSDAWQAHIVRNRIAHEGSKFDLSQREAQRTIALYERVFREFGYI